MTRSVSAVAREIQRVANKRGLAVHQQDRDQILFTIHQGTGKGTAALERYAARADLLAGLDADMDRLVAEMRECLDDLTPGQGSGKNQDSTTNRKRKP